MVEGVVQAQALVEIALRLRIAGGNAVVVRTEVVIQRHGRWGLGCQPQAGSQQQRQRQGLQVVNGVPAFHGIILPVGLIRGGSRFLCSRHWSLTTLLKR